VIVMSLPLAAAVALLLPIQAPASKPAPPLDPPPGAEAFSLLGKPLYPLSLGNETEKDREERLTQARAEYAKDPSADNAVWLGRRLSFLGRYREAIEVFSKALQQFPNDPRLVRHRGHRYISTRKFDLAVADLERAAKLIDGKPDEPEPNETPKSYAKPTSSLNYAIWYHLGLAYYLRGDFEQARGAFTKCLACADMPDKVVGATHWLYMTLRRLKRDDDAKALLAAIRPDMEILESRAYHQLCLMYQGTITPESLADGLGSKPASADVASIGYGVANWHLYNGRRQQAEEMFLQLAQSSAWPAFGVIASEAELKRGVK